jgi:hypothetical protein
VLLFALAVALTVGLAACDSGGSNSGDNDDGNEEPDVAQTFNVTVESIDDSYPYSDRNNVGVAYAIDGEVGKVISLEVGKRYEFVLGESVGSGPNGATHPFYVGNTAEGQGGDEFGENVENAKSTSGSVFFTPPESAPDSLFYQCDLHVYMGGKMNITDSAGGSNTSGDGDSGGDDGNDGSGGGY